MYLTSASCISSELDIYILYFTIIIDNSKFIEKHKSNVTSFVVLCYLTSDNFTDQKDCETINYDWQLIYHDWRLIMILQVVI